ncbi:MAG: alpha/beta hydrolase [Candidatus Heimdallarchaeota archaeon]|nr:alpha/beta hydrolase [Candidatus Heimdallarchaeota archaeon]
MRSSAYGHEPLIGIESKVVLATGLGGAGRSYPDYEAKFGKENCIIVIWDKSCTDLDAHINYLKSKLPKEPFVGIGHSLGGSIWLEICSRENIPNMKGLVLVGSARKVRSDRGMEFLMGGHWFRLWWIAILITLAFPIMLFVWGRKTFDTYREMWGFLIKDGAQKIHAQYNKTLKKLGTVTSVKNPDLPLVIVRLRKDTLVDPDDLEFTKSMFNNVHEQIIESEALHLTEKLDPVTVEKIAAEAEFLGLVKRGKIEKLQFTKRKEQIIEATK